MRVYLAILVLFYCTCTAFCDENENDIFEAGNEKDITQKQDEEPINHSAFLQLDDSDNMQIQNSRQSRLKMRKLIREIDSDKDGNISEKELSEWITQVIHKHVTDEGEKQIPKIDIDGDKHATWEEYKKAAGYSEGDKVEPKQSSETSKQQDKNKFDLADLDGDGKLSYYELGIMVHPNEHQRTSAIVVTEFLTGMDKDNDGKLSIQEFSGESVPNEIDESFSTFDTNKDGFLDNKELRDWIAPENKDPFQHEAEELIQSIDDDKDGSLTEKEIFKHYSQFATSRATKYGRLLVPGDDEIDKKQDTKTKQKKQEL